MSKDFRGASNGRWRLSSSCVTLLAGGRASGRAADTAWRTSCVMSCQGDTLLILQLLQSDTQTVFVCMDVTLNRWTHGMVTFAEESELCSCQSYITAI